MNHKKLRNILLTVLQILVILGLAAASGYFLFIYVEYGEQASSALLETEDEGKAMRQEQKLPQTIRVRILTDGFENETHSSVTLTSEQDFSIVRKNQDTAQTAQVENQKESQTDSGEDQEKSQSDSGEDQVVSQLATEKKTAGTMVQITPQDLETGEIWCVEAEADAALTVTSLQRADGNPQYSGRLYLWKEDDGIVLINELPLEEYLYGVVSSEMPSDYPLEAQKAQAVCARTYAVHCIRQRETETSESGFTAGDGSGADLNDSVAYQVYNNYRSTDISRQAVEETAGQILALSDIQYYSTSCGSAQRTDLDSEEAFAAFLDEDPKEGAEYGSRYLRWSGTLKKSVLYEKLIQAYPHLQEEQSATWSQLNPETITGVMEEQPETWAQQTTEKQLSEDAQTDVDAGSGAEANQLTATIAVRNSDGRVETLCVANENAVVTVQGEYEIRQLLGGPDLELTLMDGSCISDGTLLPSAYFYLNDQGDSWEIRGGGYGHGNGMSQCGAAALAEKGMDYQEIIGYYYSETTTG